MWWPFRPRARFINYRYGHPGQNSRVVFYQGEIWLNQKQLAAIFGITTATISEHLQKIWRQGKFDKNEYARTFKTPGADGKIYDMMYYRLEILEEIDERVNK
ncbi:hypothetical protein IJJ12_01325 [bacterium]|nr:hypothetical protein [bacterium]